MAKGGRRSGVAMLVMPQVGKVPVSRAERRRPKPLDPDALNELALAYVGRFATSRAKLASYLARKLRERGWEADTPADIEGLVAKLGSYGYVDDRAYAETSARSLVRRGFGKRRVASAMFAAGIDSTDSASALEIVNNARVSAALRLAERRRWGPFADEPLVDPALREKRIAVFLRAGHDAALARSILALPPGADVEGLE